jgi:glutathione S-transferase
VLELPDGAVVVQSNAILCYLAEGTDYMPADALGRAHVAQWLHFEQERIMRGIGSARFFLLTGRLPELVEERRALGATGLDMLEAARGDEPLIEERRHPIRIAAVVVAQRAVIGGDHRRAVRQHVRRPRQHARFHQRDDRVPHRDELGPHVGDVVVRGLGQARGRGSELHGHSMTEAIRAADRDP